jgi:hypothetical protein
LLGDFPSIQLAAGQRGRIFLAAHGTAMQPYSAMTSVCANAAPADARLAAYLNGLFADFARMGMAPKMMIVPSAPVVHGDEAPVPTPPPCWPVPCSMGRRAPRSGIRWPKCVRSRRMPTCSRKPGSTGTGPGWTCWPVKV